MTPAEPRHAMPTPGPRWHRRAAKAALVQEFLREPEHQGLSDRTIARRCGVSHQLVARVRCEGAAESAAGPVRLVQRGSTTYAMRVQPINAARTAARARERELAVAQASAEAQRVATAHRRAEVAEALERFRQRLAALGTATPAGLAYLAAQQRTRWLELGEHDARLRRAAEALVRGDVGAGPAFESAQVAYEYAWRAALVVLLSHRPRATAPDRCSRCGVAGAYGCMPNGNGVACASCRGVAW